MRRRLNRSLSLAATALVATVWLITAPATSAGDPCYHDFAIPAATTGAATQVKLMPCAFAPTIAQVAVGSTVTFVNGPNFTHLVTGANQAWGSRDVELRPGATVSYTFDKAGVYPYACALHRGMSGTIVVGDADVAAGAAGAAAGGATTAAGGDVAATAGGATADGATAGGAKTTSTSVATDTSTGPGAWGVLALAVAIGMLVGGAIVVVASRLRRSGVQPADAQTA